MKRGSSSRNADVSRVPMEIEGVTLGSTRKAPGASRRGTSSGRLGRAVNAKKKRTGKKKAAPKAGKARAPKSAAGTARKATSGKTGGRVKARAAQPVKTPARQKEIKARSAAKQERVDRSGKSNRVLGHVSARGRRKQARRDSKNG